MTLPTIPTGVFGREYLRIAGGYGAPAVGGSPAGGLDIDNAGNLATDGDVSLDGALRIEGMPQAWSQFVPAYRMWLPDAGDGPAVGPTRVRHEFLVETQLIDFAPGVSRSVVFNTALPPDYDGRTIAIDIYWTAAAGTAGDVEWRLVAYTFAPGDDLAITYVTPNIVYSTFTGVDKVHKATLAMQPDFAVPGEFATMGVRRKGDTAQDTFDGDARLMGVRLRWGPKP